MAQHASGKELHTVWNLPGINKTEFYAACIYLNAAQKQQGKTRLLPDPQRELKTSQKTRDFLDHLADCFARSKDDDKPQHVTATAMVNFLQLKKIVIAKNRAEDYSEPKPEGQKDKDFAESLQNWFNQLSTEGPYTTGPNTPEDDRHRDVWEKMLEFNDSRVLDCIKKAKKTKNKKHAIMEALKRLPATSEEHMSGFEKAWAVVDLCTTDNPTDRSFLGFKSHCIKEAEACRQDPGFSSIRLIVRKVREQDAQKKKDYKDLSELIKFIDLLGRLRHAFNTFQDYCGSSEGEGKGHHFTLEFLDSSFYPDYSWPQDCSSKVEGWYELNPEHRDALPQKVREHAMKKAKSDPKKRPPLFHCELQLLKYFIDNHSKDCQDYFGCSKKSCWLCWRILTYVDKFHTKDSHWKIYDSWAFPVLFSPEKEKLRLSIALTLTYRDLIGLIRKNIFAGRGFAEYEVQTETSGRAPEMAPIVNTSGIRRIALPKTDRRVEREVKCVCFPADGRPQCEEVLVALYRGKIDDLFEKMQPLFLAFEYEIQNSLYSAFTLVNKPSDENSFADQSWVIDIFIRAYDGQCGRGGIFLYSQSNPDAEPNPWILNQLAKQNSAPDVVRDAVTEPEDFLWRGSIFAVMMDEKGESLLREDFAFFAEMKSFLTNKFQTMTKEEYYLHSDHLAKQRRVIERRKDRFSIIQKHLIDADSTHRRVKMLIPLLDMSSPEGVNVAPEKTSSSTS